jgi:predicted helicase
MSEKAQIFYKDIGDYFSREEKLKLVSEGRSILNPALNMTELKPNEHGGIIGFVTNNSPDFNCGGFAPIRNKSGLNTIAIQQMTVLVEVEGRKLLK